ncbi:MAG: energy-coupling factor ABC transporter permease [Gammaproteobacteria bacterium]|nr:energy-coupling factor ABC transporter permease [Gammaproteobacteria bacterium]MCP5136924.1 energy-coupling factor ABC transporter permease [Gammaproteobacteria bacterium]
MFIPPELLSPGLLWAGNVLFALMLLWTLWFTPWEALRRPERHNVLFGFCVVLLMLWTIRAGTGLDPRVHVLGATTFTLTFGRRLAALGLTLALLGMAVSGAVDWPTFGVNALLNAFLPVWFADRFWRFSERHLPHHFFVYIFVAAFLGAALSFALTAATTYGVLASADVWGSGAGVLFSDQFVPMVLLLMLGEAWLNGMAMTIFVVMRPAWVATFDDQRYLAGK